MPKKNLLHNTKNSKLTLELQDLNRRKDRKFVKNNNVTEGGQKMCKNVDPNPVDNFSLKNKKITTKISNKNSFFCI